MGARFLDVRGSQQPLISSHLRERDKMLLRSVLSGRVCSGFFLPRLKVNASGVDVVGDRIVKSIYFGTVPFTLWCMCVSFLSFCLSMKRDRSLWPRCFLFHGWLPGLGMQGERSRPDHWRWCWVNIL